MGVLTWASGALFMASAWQLEVLTIQRMRRKPYCLPFHVACAMPKDAKPQSLRGDPYSTYGDFWVLMMLLSFGMLFHDLSRPHLLEQEQIQGAVLV